jgi:predicted HTH transcriptional regulator
MFLTGAIERFGTGIPEMYSLAAESGLREPHFEDNKTFLVTLWRPSARKVHDAGQVTGQVQFFNNLTEPERVVLVLSGEMMRE